MSGFSFGLVFKKPQESADVERELPVPLKSCAVKILIKGCVVDVSSTLIYHNEEDKPVECAFLFPLEEHSAVYSFQAEIQGRKIIGECQSKEEAQETYDEAVESGRTAFLLNEELTSDVFRCMVGNLPAKENAAVTISYVKELPTEVDGSVKFVLPTVLNPRYSPDGQGPRSTGTLPTTRDYSLDVQGCIKAGQNSIEKITSDKDFFEVEFCDDARQEAKVKLSNKFKLDHDLVFYVFYRDRNQPTATYECGNPDGNGFMKQDVVMLNFFPEIGDDCLTSKGEFIFIIDRSGSMHGSKIESAKETLLLFLKSLPLGCYFNVVSFGSHFEVLFEGGSVPYNEENLQKACDLEKSMDSNMGGTKILKPLKHIYQNKCIEGHPRQLFLLTDGEVWNVDDVLSLARKNAANTRVFTVGIGEGASTSLVQGLARAGGGKHEFVTGTERLQGKVMSLLRAGRQEFICDVKLDWELPGTSKIINLPSEIPPLFSGDRLVMYGLVQGMIPNGSCCKAELSWKRGEKEFVHALEVIRKPDELSTLLHRLAAKTKIQESKEEDFDSFERYREAIVLLSTSANIVSKFTSFVGVDEESRQEIGNVRQREHEVFLASRSLNYVACSLYDPPERSVFSRTCKKTSLGFGRVFSNVGSSMKKGVKSLFQAKAKKKSLADRTLYSYSLPPPQSAAVCDMAVNAPPPPPPPQHAQDDVLAMIDLQKFDGHWEFVGEVVKLLEKTEECLKILSVVKDLEIWATALVLAWLEKIHKSRRDEWDMVADKALVWMKGKSAGLEGLTPADVISAAKKALD